MKDTIKETLAQMREVEASMPAASKAATGKDYKVDPKLGDRMW